MRYILLMLITLSATITSAGQYTELIAASIAGVQPATIKWVTPAQAKKSGRLTLVYIGGPVGCQPCKKSKQAMQDARAVSLMQKYSCVEVAWKDRAKWKSRANQLVFVTKDWVIRSRAFCPTSPDSLVLFLKKERK